MSERTKLTIGNSEVRLNADGTVDEIVVGDADGRCLFHLEQMSDQCFWMNVYGPAGSITVNIFTKNPKCHLSSNYEDCREARPDASGRKG